MRLVVTVTEKSWREIMVQYHSRDITKEELWEILQHSDVRNRAAYLMLYESGMRPNTLIKLKWRHVKDEFLGHKIPMKIDLPAEILHFRISERWTFIGDDGLEALKSYLVTRWPLKDDDYVFLGEKPAGRQLTTSTISQAFNKIVTELGLTKRKERGKPKDLRLYCLRGAFRKFMIVEEAYKEFWMHYASTARVRTHYVSRDPEYHRQLYAEGYENLRLCGAEDHEILRLTRENVKLRQRVEQLEDSILKELSGLLKHQ